MPINTDTHIILDADDPSKDAVIGQGAPTVTGRQCAVWGNTLADPSFTTQTVATFWRLFSVSIEEAKNTDLLLVASSPIDPAEPDVAFAAPNLGEAGLYIGPGLTDGDRSHFVDATLKRLVNRWLEVAKGGETAAAPSV
jgi:hypothetical protein